MRLLVRGLAAFGVASIVCILHASTARSDELCAALDGPPAGGPREAAPTVASGACPGDMVEVEGDFCPFLDQICLKRPAERSYRCSLYAKSGKCQTATKHQHFCMDVYEWPNKVGEMPIVMKDWYQAKAACEGLGKRLCTEDEWTHACEGPEALPYPYGYARDATACNIDKDHPDVNEKAINDPRTRDAEVARLWQGEPSGSRERCVSAFGVRDMTGNVDEWTVNEKGKPHHSALKGGYWSWVRGRCRATTEGHEEGFRYYQIGWRCCGDPRGASPTREAKKETSSPLASVAPPPAPAAAPVPALAGRDVARPPAAKSAERPDPPKPEPPPVERVAARVAPPPPPEPREGVRGPQKGAIDIPARAAGHRVFVDGRVVAESPKAVVVDCGPRVVKIGHDGRDQALDVPCGGRVSAAYP